MSLLTRALEQLDRMERCPTWEGRYVQAQEARDTLKRLQRLNEAASTARDGRRP
jgi:hypothetical protein